MKKNTMMMTALLLSALMMTGCGDAAATDQVVDMESMLAEQTAPVSDVTEETRDPQELQTDSEAEAEPSSETTALPDAEESDAQEMTEAGTFEAAQTAFAVDLLRAVQHEKDTENVMVSPYSVAMVLGMTANGAEGTTLDETLQMLGKGIGKDALNAGLCDWSARQPDSERCLLKTVNAIWFRDAADFSVKPEFSQICEENYGAEINQAAFNQETVDTINGWVSDHTDRMIPEILDKLEDDDLMVLVNAVCFEADWMVPYQNSAIKPMTFNNADGSSIQTPFMHSEEKYYLELDGARGFQKAYAGDCAFVGILPPEGVSVQAYLDELTGEKLQQLLASRNLDGVSAYMPSFKYDTDTSLKDTLKTLGMEAAFSDFADYSGISDTPLKISKVLHKTHIEVDAQGTKAAAATAAVATRLTAVIETGVQQVLRFDRPFIYMIIDTQNDLPLFIGSVNQL